MKKIRLRCTSVWLLAAACSATSLPGAGGARPAGAQGTLAPGELDYCTVIASNFRPLRGAKIRYFGPGFFTGNHLFLDSWVVIESDEGGGGTAFGHCLVRGVPQVLGACQFTGGSGSLKGFKADVTVTTVDGRTWYWNGATSSDD